MTPTLVTSTRPISPARPGPWRTATTVVLAWEAVAGVTHVLHHRQVARHRVPYVTEIVHGLPAAGRVVAVGAITAAVADHLGKRRIF